MKFWGQDFWVVTVEGYPDLELYLAEMPKYEAVALALKYLSERKKIHTIEAHLRFTRKVLFTRMDKGEVARGSAE